MRSLRIAIRNLALAAGILLAACSSHDKTPDTTRLLARTATVQAIPPGWTRLENTFPNHPTWTFMPSTTMPNGMHALMVVLHGCNQTFDQLKQFGNLEDAATKRGILLAIPDVGNQYYGDDIQRCWNYDRARDNSHHMADIIAMVETLADSNSGNRIDRDHMYIVGLSSGGGMALDVACKRPDLFAGVGAIAGPSVGSMQGMAVFGPPWPLFQDNVRHATDTCTALAASTGNANQLDTQIASIAVGDMDRGSPNYHDRFFLGLSIDQHACDHAGQVALIPYQWDQDDFESFRGIYATDAVSNDVSVQGGLARMRVATKNGQPRVSFVTIWNVGHAWPAGKGTAPCIPKDNPSEQGAGVWIAQKGLDYPEFITGWLMANNARSAH
jgi:poly(hydroxyalkanoate) depolymerase family esterase